jgi:excisionase family DNA binding protein
MPKGSSNSDKVGEETGVIVAREEALPFLLKVDEAAGLLRTSRKGIYALVERGLLPGITRVGRRVLIRRDDLLQWLRQKSTPSPERT